MTEPTCPKCHAIFAMNCSIEGCPNKPFVPGQEVTGSQTTPEKRISKPLEPIWRLWEERMRLPDSPPKITMHRSICGLTEFKQLARIIIAPKAYEEVSFEQILERANYLASLDPR